MHQTVVLLLLLSFLPLPVSTPANPSHPESPGVTWYGDCIPPECSHDEDEIRFMTIKVVKADACGFTYERLKTQTYGYDQRLEFGNHFRAGKLLTTDGIVHVLEFSRRRLEGRTGSLTYCIHCHTALAMTVS